MFEFPGSFKFSACLYFRGAHVRYFETAGIILKQKRAGPEVGVSWTARNVAGSKESGGDGRVVNEIELKERTGMMLN